MFDFDQPVNRNGTGNMKGSFLPETSCGKAPLILAGAEMDFPTAPVIREALSKFAANGIYGFTLPDDEWYTYDKNPRKSPDVKVLATVDESSYTLSTPVKMGDHPVIWTNTSVLGRNVYFQFGHSPKLMENEAFKTLLVNSILWAAVR